VWVYAPVAVVAAVPDVTVARPSAPSRTVPGLIVRAKAGPGKPDLASSGGGSSIHLPASRPRR
jgi:tripartite-type tricarboxylate transporter receptor subunit TctC